MTEGFTTITMEPRKHIALVAHDNRKQDLIEWAMEHKEELARHALCGTGTTAARWAAICSWAAGSQRGKWTL